MPDLDQLLDTLVDDVRSKTRAPGASKAIKQAHRRRKVVATAATLAAVAVIAAGSTLAAGTLGGSDQISPIAEPTTPSPTMVQESAEPTPKSDAAELRAILTEVPGWAINPRISSPDDYDYAFNGPCSGDWTKNAISGADGGIAGARAELSHGYGFAGFPSEAQASDAAARFAGNLESCNKTAWRTQPIAQTGAVLASSAGAVAWIQQGYSEVHVLQVPTTDGPPPVDVQVAVAEWLANYIAEQND